MNLAELSLKTRVFIWSTVMGVLTVAIGLFAIATGRAMLEASHANLVENVSSLKYAEELEITLLDQKGYVSSYLLDGDPDWLAKLEEKKQTFEHWLDKAKAVGFTEREQVVIRQIRVLYNQFDQRRKKVIALGRQGRVPEAAQLLLRGGPNLMEELYQLCEELLFINEGLIAASERSNEHKLAWLEGVVWGSNVIAVLLGLLGGWLVARSVTQRLVQSEKLAALGQMAGLVAHEVRNPLTAINMRVHSLHEEAALSSSAQDDVRVIREEIERLERIVQSFLKLARLPQPRLQLVDIREPIERAVVVLRPIFERQGTRLEQSLVVPSPQVRVDAEQIQQVLVNLLLNATQAMPDGGTLRITTECVGDRWRQQLQLLIEDSGLGIAPSLRRQLFDPFVTTKADGVGLGLSLAKRIIETHGGLITLANRRQGGTTVRIVLPLEAVEIPA